MQGLHSNLIMKIRVKDVDDFGCFCLIKMKKYLKIIVDFNNYD